MLTGNGKDISAISQAATYANNTSNNTLNNNITTPAVNTSIPSSLSTTTTTTNISNATTTNTTADIIPAREVTADYTEPIVHANDSSSNISNGGSNTTINDVSEKIASDTHLTFNQVQQQPSTDAGAVTDLGNDSNSLNQTNTVSPQNQGQSLAPNAVEPATDDPSQYIGTNEDQALHTRDAIVDSSVTFNTTGDSNVNKTTTAVDREPTTDNLGTIIDIRGIDNEGNNTTLNNIDPNLAAAAQ
jgi:hypothetical protein